MLTGVGYDPEHIGVVTANRSGMSYYEHRRIGMLCHGTGDIFASVFSGLLLRGLRPMNARRLRMNSYCTASRIPSETRNIFTE